MEFKLIDLFEAFVMKVTSFAGLSAIVLASGLFTTSAEALLHDRGNGLIYDDVLDITWLQDANYAKTSGYAAANATGGEHSGQTNILVDGRMGWEAATTWADQLIYRGYDDWRLPSARLQHPIHYTYRYDGSSDRGFNITRSELGHMFYNNLGNLGLIDTNASGPQPGWGLTNTSSVDGEMVDILNLYSSVYWFGEEYVPPPYLSGEEDASSTRYTWSFGNNLGDQNYTTKASSFRAWAVRPGDVPEIDASGAGLALFLLGGFWSLQRERRKLKPKQRSSRPC